MEVFAVPGDCSRQLVWIRLPAPGGDGRQLQAYLVDEARLVLYELVRHRDPHRSWFADNHFAREGALSMLTRVDPLFLFVGPIRKATGKGQFRTLDDICTGLAQESIKGCGRLESALAPDTKWESICDTKELEGDLFVRYSEPRTLDWLLEKHSRAVAVLRAELGAGAPLATLISHANDLISMYLSADLADRFRARVRSKLKT